MNVLNKKTLHVVFFYYKVGIYLYDIQSYVNYVNTQLGEGKNTSVTSKKYAYSKTN